MTIVFCSISILIMTFMFRFLLIERYIKSFTKKKRFFVKKSTFIKGTKKLKIKKTGCLRRMLNVCGI